MKLIDQPCLSSLLSVPIQSGGTDEVFVDRNPEPRSLRNVDITVFMPDRPVHEIALRRTVDRLKFQQIAGRARKAERLTGRADNRGREIMRIRLTAAERADLGGLAEAGDPLDPAGIQSDNIDGAGSDDPLDTPRTPFAFAIRAPDPGPCP